MLVIRLARRGRNKQAFFDIVVAEKARAVQKKFIYKLGYYNPLTDGGKGTVVVDKEKAEGVFKRLPERSEVKIPVEERLIVELYSK